MKKTLLSITAVIAFGAAIILLTSGQDDGQLEACSNYDPISKLSGGAAGGYSGDPANSNKNCTNCHAGTVIPTSGLTTTNIPPTGYVPGNTYIITTGKSFTGFVRGFQTAAQGGGLQKGIFTDINPTETLIKTKTITGNVFNYIGHTDVSAYGTGFWSFNWTAPAAGSGPVTFYSAFLDGDDSGGTSGDVTYISTTVVQENLNVGIEQVSTKSNISVYPTVSKGNFTIEVNEGDYSIEIYNLTGEKVFEKTTNASVEHVSLNVNSGLYFVNIKKDNKNTIKKIVIQ
ncbi:MAG: T9SS type A sorting domain-containing protein [Bacteroidetes bacterium]|nr:T9SS type A sorting domain-containing protein [Bacteroidota bacterium]